MMTPRTAATTTRGRATSIRMASVTWATGASNATTALIRGVTATDRIEPLPAEALGVERQSRRPGPGGRFELDGPVRPLGHANPGDRGVPIRPRQRDHGRRGPPHPAQQGFELRTGGQTRRVRRSQVIF